MGHTFENTIVLNDAEIKNLPLISPVMASPGAAKSSIPLSVAIVLSPWFADYTNIDMNSLLVGDWIASPCAPFFSGLAVSFATNAGIILANGQAVLTEQEYASVFAANFAPIDLSCLLGEDFALVCTSASGALTGGDARNRLTVKTTFYVV